MPDIHSQYLCPELQAVLWCAKIKFQKAFSYRLTDIFLPSLNWDKLLYYAQVHALTPLVHEVIASQPQSVIPINILKALAERRRAIAYHNLQCTHDLLLLHKEFKKQSIRVISYKGPLLAISSYGNLSLREFGDLDLLIDKRDIKKSVDIIAAKGYRITSRYSWEITFTKEDKKELDLHYSLSPWTFPVSLFFDCLWEHAHRVRIADEDIVTFCPEHNLMVLCVQVSKDAWEDRLTLNKLCDIAALLSVSHQQFNWFYVLHEAALCRLSRILYFGLALTKAFLDIKLPALILKELRQQSWIEKGVLQTVYRVAALKIGKKSGFFHRMQLHFFLQESLLGKASQVGMLLTRLKWEQKKIIHEKIPYSKN
ncbi:nucleotidyltransferase family protein [Nitrosococcus wardiae]|uniref:nucleotidyltransferase domain-containing protein n=1 Tax=Nitrosococcus wardiae TaxID=1814290 RepID=UPI0023EA763C|nr:nucleotidyltransferase family protein [Nitrosococcus wardiae]